MKNEIEGEEKLKASRRLFFTIRGPCNIIGIILCVLLVPILLINCILIVKGMLHPSEVPSLGGYCPLIVLTESMEPDIRPGDLIICKKLDDASEIEVGTTISFFDPAGSGGTVVTHRINSVERDEATGAVYYRTQGINNNIEDRLPVPEENVIGIYTGVRFAHLGRLVLFAQTPIGLIVCILVPIALFIIAFYLEHRLQNKKRGGGEANAAERIARLEAELEALKAHTDEPRGDEGDEGEGDDGKS